MAGAPGHDPRDRPAAVMTGSGIRKVVGAASRHSGGEQRPLLPRTPWGKAPSSLRYPSRSVAPADTGEGRATGGLAGRFRFPGQPPRRSGWPPTRSRRRPSDAPVAELTPGRGSPSDQADRLARRPAGPAPGPPRPPPPGSTGPRTPRLGEAGRTGTGSAWSARPRRRRPRGPDTAQRSRSSATSAAISSARDNR